MDSIPKPWFQDPELVQRTQTNDRSHAWPKGTKPPDSPDTRETSIYLWETLKPLRPLVLGLLIALGLVNVLVGASAADGKLALLLSLLSIVVTGTIWALLFSLAIPARRLVFGGSIPTGHLVMEPHPRHLTQLDLRLIAQVYPKVLATTILTSILLMVAALMCVLPFFFLLPLVVRAPYESTLGAGPIEAIRRSFRSARAHHSLAAGASNEIVNGVIALFLISILGDLMVSYFGISEIAPQIMFSVLRIGVFFMLWHICLANFLNGDAAMAGALVPENIARLRTPSKPPLDRFFLGKFFMAVRMIVPVIGIALIASHIMGEMQRQSTANLPPPGTPAPEFTLSELDGPLKESAEYQGTPTILYFWAPWCAPCAGQTAELHELMDEVGDEVDIVSIALSFGDLDEIRDYVREKDVRYTVLIGDDELLEYYKIGSFPTVMLLDANGLVISNWTGVTGKSTLLGALPK